MDEKARADGLHAMNVAARKRIDDLEAEVDQLQEDGKVETNRMLRTVVHKQGERIKELEELAKLNIDILELRAARRQLRHILNTRCVPEDTTALAGLLDAIEEGCC